nr:helix-turn-helix transcriptional regulator [Oceanococcus sp. HetDA_MAG_MS8]
MGRLRWSNERKVVADLLRAKREDAGLTQVELAVALGKPQSHVSKFESGDRGLELQEIDEVCLACGTTIADFAIAYEARVRKPSSN